MRLKIKFSGMQQRDPESASSCSTNSGISGGEDFDRLRANEDARNLLRQRKLCLVLDLDHTLLHSKRTESLTSDEEYLKKNSDEASVSSDLVDQGLRYFPSRITKLRPFLQTFLQEASSMFDMYVNTMGNREYAAAMVNLLDPNQEYFNSDRVISREDNPQGEKSLALVPRSENMVIIVDDTESVWPKNKDNLTVVDKYYFFHLAESRKEYDAGYRSHSQLRSDESESEGALARTLDVLRRVHSKFFAEYELGDQNALSVDRGNVRELLKMKPGPQPSPRSWNLEDELALARWLGKEDYIRWTLKNIEARKPNWFGKSTHIRTRRAGRMLMSHYIFMAVISMNLKKKNVIN